MSRESPEAIAWAIQVKRRDRWRCFYCGKVDHGAHAHHVKAWASHPGERLNLENGQTVCRVCHGKMHGKQYVPDGREDWVFECVVCHAVMSFAERAGGMKSAYSECICEECFLKGA